MAGISKAEFMRIFGFSQVTIKTNPNYSFTCTSTPWSAKLALAYSPMVCLAVSFQLNQLTRFEC